MWTFHRLPHAIAGLAVATLLFAGDEASAQSANSSYPGYSNGQSYNYGLQLPQLVPSSGQDEIRAVDGTTCRSSVSNNGAYVDMGAIAGQNGDGSFGSGAVYGRLVVPIGGEEKRLDCTRLYELEVARLKLELELLQAGLGKSGRSIEGKASGIAHALDEDWIDEGFKESAHIGQVTKKLNPKARKKTAFEAPDMHLMPKMSVGVVVAETDEPEVLPWLVENRQEFREWEAKAVR